ncbi:HU family DNA-binding protein [Rhizobium leguminosarum]
MGRFSMRNRSSRSGRNLKNGTLVFIEEKWATFFRRGNEMQQHLNRL